MEKYGPRVFWGNHYFAVDAKGYYRNKRAGGLLHRLIWENEYGPIPPGTFVHHKDGNPLNNDLSNLELATPKEHSFIHPRGFAVWTSEYRGSHTRTMWKVRTKKPKICAQCGITFKSTGMRAKFCSRKCRKKFYYERNKTQ